MILYHASNMAVESPEIRRTVSTVPQTIRKLNDGRDGTVTLFQS